MRNNPDTVMLFAAGLGTRMRHLTADRPKPLVEVAGVPLIEHTLSLAKEIAPKKIIANLHYKPEMLKRYLEDRGVETILEAPHILETGGGLKNAIGPLKASPVFTANTDALWHGPNPFQCLLNAWEPQEMDALLLCIPRDRALGHLGDGDFVIDPTGHLRRGPGDIFGGIQIIKTDILEKIEDASFSLNIVWSRMLEEQRLFGVRYPGRWCDVGTPEGVLLAEQWQEASDV